MGAESLLAARTVEAVITQRLIRKQVVQSTRNRPTKSFEKLQSLNSMADSVIGNMLQQMADLNGM
jgi:predicted transcriptional regulator